MRMADINELTMPELWAKERDLRRDMFNLRLQQASAQLEKPARIRTLRRDIARIKTRLSQLQREERSLQELWQKRVP